MTDLALTNGYWAQRGMIKVWVHVEPLIELKQEPTYDPRDLIACPTCHAHMDERCKGWDGRPLSRSHGSRLVKRVCSCGMPVRFREPMCGFCRAEMAVSQREEAAA